MECVHHPGTQITAVCVTCDTTLVCVDCITDERHDGHVFRKPSKIANKIKAKLMSKEAEDCKLLSSLKSYLNEVGTLITQQNDDQKERVRSINTRKEVIIQAAYEMADDLISQYETQTQDNRNKLQGAIGDISKNIENVRRHKNGAKRIIGHNDDLAVVRESRQLEEMDEHNKSSPKLATIEFTPGEVNTSQLELMFRSTAATMDDAVSIQGAQAPIDFTLSTNQGSDFVGTLMRQHSELILKSTFRHSQSNYVFRMCYTSDGQTWVRCFNGRELSLTDRHGHVEKTVTFDSVVGGMTTVNDGTLLLCGRDDRDIKQVTLPSGKVTSVFNTCALHPLDICTAPSGDLYVTMTDKLDYNVTFDSERALVRYSPHGQEKARAGHDKRGDALFVRPWRVRNSSAGDMLGVINATDSDNSHLVLLNLDLTSRSRYLGDSRVMSAEEKFDTTTYKPDMNYYINDFIFDSLDNIIICEHYSRCVQLLSRDCLPMLTLRSTQESSPMTMAMPVDELWLGFKDGTVKVYKYK